MDDAPALPGPFQRRRRQLSVEHQIRIPHGDPSLKATARSRRTAGPRASLAAPVSVTVVPLALAWSARGTVMHRRLPCRRDYLTGGTATSMVWLPHPSGAITQSRCLIAVSDTPVLPLLGARRRRRACQTAGNRQSPRLEVRDK